MGALNYDVLDEKKCKVYSLYTVYTLTNYDPDKGGIAQCHPRSLNTPLQTECMLTNPMNTRTAVVNDGDVDGVFVGLLALEAS